jgi:hypothetical protein
MVFPSSRPNRIPPATTDSQYDTTTGYSSSSYTKWPRPPAKTGFYAARNVGSATTPVSRQYQNNRRRYNLAHNDSYTDISPHQYFQAKQQQPIYSNISPQRPTVNYLLP